MSEAQAQAFFAHYAERFTAGDGDAIADLWHTPSSIADTHEGVARVTAWTDEAPMRANMRALCAVYAKAGSHRWGFELRDVQALGECHVFVRVRWHMFGADGVRLQQFETGYQLGRTAAGWRVLFCVAYEERLDKLGVTL